MLTDTISFNLEDKCEAIDGEIYISLNQVSENAKEYNQDIGKELKRVIIHGFLHLVGYDDQTPGDKKNNDTPRRSLSRETSNIRIDLLIDETLRVRFYHGEQVSPNQTEMLISKPKFQNSISYSFRDKNNLVFKLV